MGRDDLAQLPARDLLAVDGLLYAVVPQVRHLHQVHATLERWEVLVLLERVQVSLVGAGEEKDVEVQDGVGEADGALLACREQVLVAVEWLLEQVVVLEQSAVCVDEVPERLEQTQRPQGRRQRLQLLVHRQLSDPGVDVQLGLDRHEPLAVAAREEEALDLHVLEHPLEVTVVRVEQRIGDGPRPWREITVDEVVTDPRVRRDAPVRLEALEDGPPPLLRQQQHRMVPQIAGHPRVDVVLVEVGEALELAARPRLVAGRPSEAQALLRHARRGEDPVEPVHRALIGSGVDLETARQGTDERGLGRAVGPVQQHQARDTPLLHEVREHAVEIVLRLLLPHHAV